MLDNDGEDADEEDEAMGDWKDSGIGEEGSEQQANAQALEGNGMELRSLMPS